MTLDAKGMIVRPTFGLLLRRYFDSGEGKFFGLLFLVSMAAPWSVNPLVGVLGSASVLAIVGLLLFQTRMEVRPGELLIGNFGRTVRIPSADLLALQVQPITYSLSGAALKSTARLIATTTELDRRGQHKTIPAFATERKSVEVVAAMQVRAVNELLVGKGQS